MREKKRGNIPTVLEERLLIDEKDRELLVAASELSPHNNGRLLITSSLFDNYVPSISQIASSIGMDEKEARTRFENIGKVWDVPIDTLPTNNGYYSEEESIVNALVNQHNLRWDEALNDYKVTKMHWLSGEMGTGTLFTNNDAFLGEKIVRQAMGVDEKLISYHMQGGIMPDIVTLFGKAKNKRAIMTGLNKSDPDVNDNELEILVQEMNLLKKELGLPSLSKKSIDNVKTYVGTMDSMEEAAESVGYELADQVKNLKPFSELHLYFSYNDDYNMSEIEDKNIAILRDIHKRMKEAEEKLPELLEKEDVLKEELIKSQIDSALTNRYFNFLMEKRNEENGEFAETGKGFKEYTNEFFQTKEGARRYALDKKLRKELREKAQDTLGRDFENFDSLFEDVWNRFYNLDTTMKQVSKHRETANNNVNKLEKNLKGTQDKIHEAEAFKRSQMVEEMEGHAWFTKKIAIKPTEAKALETIKKEVYKALYEKHLIPSLEKHSGRDDLQIFLHTDDIISTEIPDPQDSIEGRKNDPNRPIGTIFTSIPRTNAQWSNEPLTSSFGKVQSFHAGEISNAIATGKERPKTKEEFNKRNFAHTDVMFSSWGADGYLSQPKFTVDPSTVKGEYVGDSHMTRYNKLPTRHDLSKLGDLMNRGNKGTWAGKRLAKGGSIAGSVLHIEHANGAPEEIFFDDRYFKEVALTPIDENGTTLGEKYNELEGKILETKDKRTLNKLEKERQELLEIAKPHIGYLFLKNDEHLGSYSTPGRPSNVDTIASSQLAVMQTYGVQGLEMSLMTEALHGFLAFRSYDSKRESATNNDVTYTEDPVAFMDNLKSLEQGMRRQGASDKEILEAVHYYTEEFSDGRSTFKQEDQKNMFMKVLGQAELELMENGVPLQLGTGNHWMGQRDAEDEANVIASMLDGNGKYQSQGMLRRGQSASGQSFTFDYVKLPSLDGKGIDLAFAHKFWHGDTEISQISNQLVKARSPAIYAAGADRHHGGAGAQHGKMFVLDMGKQLTIPYAKMIGKCASANGHMTMGYGKNNELVLASRYFLNDVIEKISGWDYKAGILSNARSLINEVANDDSVAREYRRMNFAMRNSQNKVNELEKKLERKI